MWCEPARSVAHLGAVEHGSKCKISSQFWKCPGSSGSCPNWLCSMTSHGEEELECIRVIELELEVWQLTRSGCRGGELMVCKIEAANQRPQELLPGVYKLIGRLQAAFITIRECRRLSQCWPIDSVESRTSSPDETSRVTKLSSIYRDCLPQCYYQHAVWSEYYTSISSPQTI